MKMNQCFYFLPLKSSNDSLLLRAEGFADTKSIHAHINHDFTFFALAGLKRAVYSTLANNYAFSLL